MSGHLTMAKEMTELDLAPGAAPEPTLLGLPTEIQHEIVSNLSSADFPDKYSLRLSCRYFYNLIPAMQHSELLEVESGPYCVTHKLFACKDCLRLRPASKFADKMRKRKRNQGGEEKSLRFCIECGIKPKAGTTRYTRGSYLEVMRVPHVICIRCGRFGQAGTGEADKKHCYGCWSRQLEQQRRREKAENQNRLARVRAERQERHRRMRDTWGSEYESSSEENFRIQ
jgi:hypothetical protein